ncbi:MAG: glycosyltransferase family 2 protein [Lachnospiraceae bacterium]|nr:glycosyltransferase family 2 protein [Lachnospiraceae bacterium]
MKTAVGSVVYSEAIEFIDDFLESLRIQSTQDFDIILISDNIAESYFRQKFEKYILFFDERIIFIPTREMTPEPYKLRIELLKISRTLGIDLLVLCDCDDICSANRVEATRKAYQTDIVFLYNELKDFNENNVMPELPLITNDFMQISEYNYLGLSNTAVILKNLNESFLQSLYKGKTPIFDWYFFSRILLDGGMGKRIDRCCTYYRIHQNNIAGIPDKKAESLEREKKVKLEHYLLLSEYMPICLELEEKYKNIELKAKGDGLMFWWGQLS